MRTNALAKKNMVKIFASVVLVGGAASVAGLGTFGSFTSTTAATTNVSAGKVVLTSGPGVVGTTVSAANLLPGDTVQRTVVLARSSDTETFGSVKLTTSAGSANLLSTDTTQGLQLSVDNCASAWTKNADNSLSCAGGATTVIASRAVIGNNLDLGAATTALNAAGATANLRLSLVLPTAADNSFQGLSNAVTFTFDATQKTASTNR